MEIATTKPDLTGLGYAALMDIIAEAKDELESQKAWIATIQDEIDVRLAPSVAAAIREAGKQHGTINLPIQGGLIAKGEISKSVVWDSAKLIEIAQTMPWERVSAVFNIKFSVSEKTWDGIVAVGGPLADKIKAARTVKYSAPKVTITEGK